jgi:hypothetical protein
MKHIIPNLNIQYLEAYHFESKYPIFKDYVKNFYDKKTTASEDTSRLINKILFILFFN